MVPDIQVRPAQLSDVNAIVQFNTALARETEEKQLAPSTVLQGVRALLESPKDGFYVVAVAHREILGCAMVTFEWSDWRNGCFWWIQSVYIRRSFRRQGVFRRLYEHIKTQAEQRNDVCGLRLYVENNNLAAQTTYQSLGMQAVPYRLYEFEFSRSDVE